MKKGKFIVFEGIDGAGKSTQAKMLADYLSSKGRQAVLTAEPTSLESGKALRRALSGAEKKSEEQLAMMFVSDRIAHNEEGENGIIALLERGIDVISDRYYYSTLAYQGQTTDYEWVKSMNKKCPKITRPDICFYLDLSAEESLSRIKARNETLEIYENTQKLTAVRASFMAVIDDLRSEGENITVIDASKTVDEMAKAIATETEKIL